MIGERARILLYNLITMLFDESQEDFEAIDSEDFKHYVCSSIGLTHNEWDLIMGNDAPDDKYKKLLLQVYNEDSTIIDDVACMHCPRKKDGECPLKEYEECKMPVEEAIGLYIKYGLS